LTLLQLANLWPPFGGGSFSTLPVDSAIPTELGSTMATIFEEPDPESVMRMSAVNSIGAMSSTRLVVFDRPDPVATRLERL
jgi:hypothetical protein